MGTPKPSQAMQLRPAASEHTNCCRCGCMYLTSWEDTCQMDTSSNTVQVIPGANEKKTVQACCQPCMQLWVGISNQVCCQSSIQAIAVIRTQMHCQSYLQASVVPGIGMPSLTGMTQPSAPALAMATGRSRRRVYTRPAGWTTTILRHNSPACHCQVTMIMMIMILSSDITPSLIVIVGTTAVMFTLSGFS